MSVRDPNAGHAEAALSPARQGAAGAVVARRTAVIRDRGGSCGVLTAGLEDAARARRAVADAVDRCTRWDVLSSVGGRTARGNNAAVNEITVRPTAQEH